MLMKKILIVEDNSDTAKVLATKLEGAGFEIQTAADAAQGLTAAHQFRPHLIVLDLLIPGGGGISLLKRLKLSVHTNTIPVMVLTGIEKDAEEDVRALGVQVYLRKPFDPQQVLEEIKRILGIT